MTRREMPVLAGNQMPLMQPSHFTKCIVWYLKDKIGTHVGSRGNIVQKCHERRELLLLLLLLVLYYDYYYYNYMEQRPSLDAEDRKFSGRFTLF
jgi:hypothetical protein